MKSVKLAYIALGLIAFAFTSCKKSSDNKPVANTISLKFNGTAYSTSNIIAVDSAGYFELIGTVNSTTSINLIIIGGFKVGSFDLAGGAGAINFIAGLNNYYTSTAGTITVTSLTSTSVSGTFSFTGANILTSANGSGSDGTFTTTYTTKK